MALERAQLTSLGTSWVNWFDHVDELLGMLEPILEVLVEIREQTWWAKLPFLRRLRPPEEVGRALLIVRALRQQLG